MRLLVLQERRCLAADGLLSGQVWQLELGEGQW
jgi:hypothetical protein